MCGHASTDLAGLPRRPRTLNETHHECAAAGTPPRVPHHLPLRPARLLGDAHPVAERVQSLKHLQRHAITFNTQGKVKRTTDHLSRGNYVL